MALRRELLIGRPAPVSLDLELRRALAPMIAQVRATLPRVRSPGDARAVGAALRKAWPDARLRAIVEAIGRKAEASASRPWGRFDRAGRGDARRRREYDGRALVDRWSRDAAKRIVSVRNEVAEGLRRDVVAALETDLAPAELAARWRRQGIPVLFGTLEGRTKVIAQNQLATLHAQVQSERARAVGVESFVWRTQQDDRVRDEHQALEGTQHAYADPPSEGLPGTPINCRCWAESLITEDIAAAFGFGIGGAPE